MMKNLLAIFAAENTAQQLSQKLNIKIIKKNITDYPFVLLYKNNRLSILQTATNNLIYADFLEGKIKHRRLYGGGRQQTIAKAIGLKGKNIPTVLDATVGLGQDSFVLAALGCKVTMLEKSSIIAALLADSLTRASRNKEVAPIINRMKLIIADSIQHIQTLTPKQKPDVIYLDPMFPPRKKSALVKKEMQVLQAFLSQDNNEAKLLQVARNYAKKRIVVKRPKLAPSIDNQKPDITFKGKSCRFDVYLVIT
jgi:16S rRNA (guanine1516-N2)-methyltransferase